MYNLLILDDEPLFRQYTRSVIDWQELGFEVFEADNGKTGIDIVKSRDIALVFADINMPIMDGIEFGRIAKKIKPDIYIVIVSGYGEFEFTKKAIKIGVNDYILKPFSEEEIKEVVYKIKDNLDKKYGVIKGLKKKQGLMAENVKAYIALNFTRANLSVSEIARHFYVDSSYIRRVFKKAYNMSITEYILNLRMEKAKELLVENNFKLSVICEKVGFEDYNYFSRVFKRYCGISPKVYEINNKNMHNHGAATE